MDPSIMKLLEDDEDESMHSGAEVEALSAALNRDIGGDAGTITSTSEPDAGLLAAGSSAASQQILKDWQNSRHEENNTQNQQNEERRNLESVEQHHLSQGDVSQPGFDVETQDKQVGNQQGHMQLSSQADNQQQGEKVNLFQSADKEKANKSEDPLHGGKTSKQATVQYSVQLNNQQVFPANEVDMESRKAKLPASSVPFHLLIPILRPHLDKDRSMQLQAVFAKLRNNEVSKEDFLRVIRNIVGDQMLRQAVHKLQMQLHAQTSRAAQANPNQYPLQAQSSSSQQLATGGVSQITESQSFLPLNSPSSQKGGNQPYIPASIIQMRVSKNSSALENTGQSSQETDNKMDSNGVHPHNYSANISMQGINKQQQLTQLPQSSFSMYGSTTNFSPHAHPRPSITSATTFRPTNQASTPLMTFQSVVNMPKHDHQNISVETKRPYTGPVSSHSTSQNTVPGQISATKEQKSSSFPLMSYEKQEAVDLPTEHPNKSQSTTKDDYSFISMHLNQGNSTLGMMKNDIAEKQLSKFGSSSTSSIGAAQIVAPMSSQLDQSVQVSSMTHHHGGASAKTPVKKASIGHKKPLEAPLPSPPIPSKKQKTSGTFLDQSIEQLNDVTAVSGVDLREEEEQLLSAPKEESRASEATRRVLQEEEEKLLLQKGALQRKLEDIMLKSGVSSMSNDVMRCLSMCVEECLRGLITRLIRLSKQRIDIERTRHLYVITSDVQRQILAANKKAREEWDEKQADEAEKLRKPNETDGSTNVDVDKDKEEGRPKNLKINKEEDDKMRTTAANVAARAAFGGDDMLSKWQLMAEQARQKRDGHDVASSVQPDKGPSGKAATFGRSSREQHESEKKGHSTSVSAGGRKFGSSAVTAHPKVVRSISLKDVVAVLEKEPQMSRSTLLYRLYDKLPGDSLGE